MNVDVLITSNLFRIDGDWLIDSAEVRVAGHPIHGRPGGGIPLRAMAKGGNERRNRVAGGGTRRGY